MVLRCLAVAAVSMCLLSSFAFAETDNKMRCTKEQKSCRDFLWEVEELESKALLLREQGRSCRAKSLMRQACSLIKRAPSNCKKDPGWNSILMDHMRLGEKWHQRLTTECSASK